MWFFWVDIGLHVALLGVLNYKPVLRMAAGLARMLAPERPSPHYNCGGAIFTALTCNLMAVSSLEVLPECFLPFRENMRGHFPVVVTSCMLVPHALSILSLWVGNRRVFISGAGVFTFPLFTWFVAWLFSLGLVFQKGNEFIFCADPPAHRVCSEFVEPSHTFRLIGLLSVIATCGTAASFVHSLCSSHRPRDLRAPGCAFSHRGGDGDEHND